MLGRDWAPAANHQPGFGQSEHVGIARFNRVGPAIWDCAGRAGTAQAPPPPHAFAGVRRTCRSN